ncbi:MAG: amidohydrolase family protein [Beijerinckiaceae bacterium]|jgi:predicted TIM-barrel fold metal-dependent hydrolase|nr:amidohydrolase family protein [Beijerinckiaceae bacterium]
MASAQKIPVIALEEHYWDAELVSKLTGAEGTRSPDLLQRLHDLGEIRLREMDEAGIDIQVLSHGAPSGQKLPEDIAVSLVRGVNDRLHQAISLHPTRFAGFAALPTIHPEAAADELDRCVSELGFKGAMIHGLTNGLWLDDKRFWPIFARAEKLRVPIYLHPSFPHADVMKAYYADYAKDYPQVIRAAWGYTVEAATQAIRLVLSRVFETHPGLNIVLGHMGETLPFLLWRINQALSRPGHEELSFREQFTRHFYVTTSGNFSTPALMCTMTELGMDRIMFAVDWPFVANKPAMDWVNDLQISRDDKTKLLSGNAKRLLRM